MHVQCAYTRLGRFGGGDRCGQSSLDTRKLERHGGYDRLGDASACLVKPRYGGTAEPLRHRAAWHRVEVGDAFQTKPRGGDKRFRRQPQCRERQICNGLRLSPRVEDSNARAAVARQRVGSAGRARDCDGCGESKPIEKAEQSTAKPLLAAEQVGRTGEVEPRSEEHTSELQSLMRISYAVFCLKKKKRINKQQRLSQHYLSIN